MKSLLKPMVNSENKHFEGCVTTNSGHVAAAVVAAAVCVCKVVWCVLNGSSA